MGQYLKNSEVGKKETQFFFQNLNEKILQKKKPDLPNVEKIQRHSPLKTAANDKILRKNKIEYKTKYDE